MSVRRILRVTLCVCERSS